MRSMSQTAITVGSKVRVLRVRDRITDAAGVAPLLAGSGSTWFLRGHFDWLAEALPETTVVLTRTVDPA